MGNRFPSPPVFLKPSRAEPDDAMCRLLNALIFFAERRPPQLNMDSLPSLILCLVALGIFVAIAFYIASKLREGSVEDGLTPSESMSLFSEMYEKGEMTLEEYRAVKTRLAETLSTSFSSPSRDGGGAKDESRSDRKKSKSKRKGAATVDRDGELERLLSSERR